MLLAGEVDATTFLGFLAQSDMMLKWMAEERLARGARPFGDLLRAILADERKAEWCRRWGALIEWANRKALYDASVTSFEASGRTGPNERWRRQPMTPEQADLVDTLCCLLREPAPTLANKGAAYEWIKERGGNPTYWEAPAHPDSWIEGDDV